MLSEITLGQYIPASSPVHRLDPRIKIISSLVYIVAVFLAKSFFAYAFLLIATVGLIKLSKIKVTTVLKGVKPIIFLIAFTAVINIFMTGTGDVWVKIGFLKITYAGVRTAVSMSLRLVFLVVGTSMLTYTTSPIMLTDGIESLLKPFSKIGLPAHELAMMMTIALRFIPTLLEETDKIINAQKSRGADFESGNLINRAKALMPVLVPLFINSFRRADELAMAMECRCYRGGQGRTRLRELHICKGDIFCLFIVVVFVALVLCLNIIRIGEFI